MGEYIAFWRRYADFQGKATRQDFWTAILVWSVVSAVLGIVLPLIALLALNLVPEQAVDIARCIFGVYELVSIVPLLSVTVRRLRDAGYSAKSFFWLLLPGIGGIAFLVRLCAKSKAD